MSRLRTHVLFAAGVSSLLFASLAIADTTAATSTTEPDSGAVESNSVDAATASSSPDSVRPVPMEPLPAGTYSSEVFATPLTYTVPDGWKMFEDEPGQFGLALVANDGPCLCIWRDVRAASRDCAEEPEPGVGGTAEDIATWLVDHPGLNTSEPKPVTVGGLDGVMIDVAMASSWTEPCPFSGGQPVVMTTVGTEISRGVHWGTDANDSQRMYLLDLSDGGNIAIVVEVGFGPAYNDLASPEFQARIDTVTPVIDSFQFDLSGIVADTTAEAPSTS